MESPSTKTEGKPSPMAVLGNHAVAYGLLDGGTDFASSYPGTPATEVMEQLVVFGKKGLMCADWATNEAIGLLEAGGAAISGVNSVSVCKHVGLNVAMDPLMTLTMTGVRGSLVLVVADDPAMHSSQNEQDNRIISLISGMPVFEPATIQECYDLAREAVAYSRKYEMPVMFRLVTRVSHAVGAIERKPRAEWEKLELVHDAKRFVVVPGNARVNHHKMLDLYAKMSADAETSQYWREIDLVPDPEMLIISAGSSSNYAHEAAIALGLKAKLFIPQLISPLPLEKLHSLLKSFKKVLIVEELEPFLERQVREIAQRQKLHDLVVIGKEEGLTSREGEMLTEVLMANMATVLGLKDVPAAKKLPQSSLDLLRARPPLLCPGCPHRETYVALTQALRRKEPVYCNDIGCYSLGVLPPHNTADIILCMGSSIGTATSIGKLHPDKTAVALIGDSTFWHYGLPGLANAVWHNAKILVVVLDNYTTAMTGDQPNPSSRQRPVLSIEKVCEAVGAKTVVLDPFDLKATRKVFKDLADEEGVKVVISRSGCIIPIYRKEKAAGELTTIEVDEELCNACGICADTGCPALLMTEKVVIVDKSLCVGCNYCVDLCTRGALKEVPLQ